MNTQGMNQSSETTPEAKRQKSLLPLLTVVFIVAWGLLTLLVVLQDRMIDAQSDLIHVLFADKVQEAAIKPVAENIVQEKGTKRPVHTETGSLKDPVVQVPFAKTPSAQAPLSQVPLAQVPFSENAVSQPPSSQVKPKAGDKSGRSSRKMRSPFSPPPAEVTDPLDKRRVSISI